ncbi:MAG TPA: DUF4062 domain-containing protein [Nannocystaceae bacterium]|nr:DUF4062 domain-containing protein [Nannocystaceae bacterium]
MLDVMLSSTCYDLLDLRSEIFQFLTEKGMSVRLSEDFDSGFEVNPSADSIATCLENIAKTDVVVLLIDRRYGPPLPTGHPYEGFSATEAEIRHADSLKKPVITFIRESAHTDYRTYKGHGGNPPKLQHIQDKPERITKIMKLIEGRMDLSDRQGASNWVDLFKTSANLKPLLLRRIEQAAPAAARNAMFQRVRAPRLIIEDEGLSGDAIGFQVRNIGPGTILSLNLWSHCTDNPTNSRFRYNASTSGLMEGERFGKFRGATLTSGSTRSPISIMASYMTPAGEKCNFVGTYAHNAHKDRYQLKSEVLKLKIIHAGAEHERELFKFDHLPV